MASFESNSLSQVQQTGLLSISEAAKFCGVHINTLRKYSNSGQLITYRTPGRDRRYLKSDLADSLAEKVEKKMPSMKVAS
jgi:predicted site-specific integrase-resolvase